MVAGEELEIPSWLVTLIRLYYDSSLLACRLLGFLRVSKATVCGQAVSSSYRLLSWSAYYRHKKAPQAVRLYGAKVITI